MEPHCGFLRLKPGLDRILGDVTHRLTEMVGMSIITPQRLTILHDSKYSREE
jgi:hypothetical protein